MNEYNMTAEMRSRTETEINWAVEARKTGETPPNHK